MRALTLSLLLALPALAAEAPRPECPSGEVWSKRRNRCERRHRIDICSPVIVAVKRDPDAVKLHERKVMPERELLVPPESFLPQP